jgi:P27 family predicted phage terminase small subunit
MGSIMNILTENGQLIFNQIKDHTKALNLSKGSADDLELTTLAHNYDLYFRMAEYCNKNGYTQKPDSGGWDQVRPEYTIMQKAYTFILKHSGKYGLTPGDRAKIFAIKSEKEKEDDPFGDLKTKRFLRDLD